MKKLGISFFLLTTVAALSACGGETNETENTEETDENTEANTEEAEPLHIYTTLYAWEYMAKEIGGEHVQVENIVPPGSDLHNYEPTSQTMIDIAESDLFIYNGAGIEGFAGAINDTLEAEDVERLEVTGGMNLLSHEEDDDHGHEEDNHGHEEEGDEDPHVWLDPERTIEGAGAIRDQLVASMPEQEEEFENNFSDLEQQLQDLNESFQTMANEADKNEFIVSHAGYGYWEERYDLHQIGISGLSPSDEPSQRDIQNIISLSEEENINHIMFEQNIPSGIAEVVQEETGTEALNLHNLEALTEEDIENEEDYFTIMNQNIENLEIALNE